MDPTNPTGRVGSADIAGLLRREIGRGRLAPKDKLPAERALAETYGVARGTIREALTQLADEGLVHVRAGSGTYVSDSRVRPAEVSFSEHACSAEELLEVRLALEPHICRLAATKATRTDIDRANDQIDAMTVNSNDSDKFLVADHGLHAILAESTGNKLLIQISHQIAALRDRERGTAGASQMDQATIEHRHTHFRQLLGAIKEQDSERAATLKKEQLETERGLP